MKIILTVNRHGTAESKKKFVWRPVRYCTQIVFRLAVVGILCHVAMCVVQWMGSVEEQVMLACPVMW
jgi:hypothetical protein